MTKFFDSAMMNKITRNKTRHIISFCCICAILVAGAILSAVFWKQLTRAVAQTIATICVVLAGCYVVFFAQYIAYNKKMTNICRQVINNTTKLNVTVNLYEIDTITYKFLSFHVVDTTLENGEIRRFYLYDGKMENGQKYSIDVYENIICAYKELL